MDTNNPYEVAGRLKKAYELARVLFRLDATPEAAAQLTHDEWCKLAAVAKVKPPSEQTRKLAVDRLRKFQDPSAFERACA